MVKDDMPSLPHMSDLPVHKSPLLSLREIIMLFVGANYRCLNTMYARAGGSVHVEIELQSNKEEDRYIIPFAEHRFDSNFNVSSLTIVGLNPKYGKTPDYYLREVKTLVEVKRLIVEERIRVARNMGYNMARLEEATKRCAQGRKTGNCAVVLPHNLKIRFGGERDVAEAIVRAAVAGERRLALDDGTELTIMRLQGEEDYIGFVSSYVYFTYADSFRSQLCKILGKAASQLASAAFSDNDRRVLLLLCPQESDSNNADDIARVFSDIRGSETLGACVDEVWLQAECSSDRFEHHNIYERSRRNGIANCS